MPQKPVDIQKYDPFANDSDSAQDSDVKEDIKPEIEEKVIEFPNKKKKKKAKKGDLYKFTIKT